MTWRFLFSLSLVSFAAGVNNTRCFECTDLPLPSYCTHVTECAPDHKCVVEEVITSGGLILYSSGCLSQTSCSQTGRRSVSSSLSRRSDVLVCANCCEGEFCNYQGCGFKAKQQPQRGPLCFRCDYQNEPDECRNIMGCDLGEVCMLTELARNRPDGRPLYRSSCAKPIDCHAQANIYSVLGKKRGTNCHSCCAKDFCNDNCTAVQVSVPTSSSTPTVPTTESTTTAIHVPTKPPTTQKPSTTTPSFRDICHQHNYSYASSTNLCFRLHRDKRNWDSANDHCKREGGLLAIIDTKVKWTFLRQVIVAYGSDVYIGGRDTGHHDNDFHWLNGARVTFNDWSHDQPDGGKEDCIYVSSKYHFEWHDTRCDHDNAYICTISSH